MPHALTPLPELIPCLHRRSPLHHLRLGTTQQPVTSPTLRSALCTKPKYPQKPAAFTPVLSVANLPILDPPFIPHLLLHNLADVVDAATSPCHAVDSSTPPPGLFSLLTAASPIGLHAPFGPHPVVGERSVISCLTPALFSTHPAQMITDQHSAPLGARQTFRFTPARASGQRVCRLLIQLHERGVPTLRSPLHGKPSPHRCSNPTRRRPAKLILVIHTISSGLSSPATHCGPTPSAPMILSVVPIGGQSKTPRLPVHPLSYTAPYDHSTVTTLPPSSSPSQTTPITSSATPRPPHSSQPKTAICQPPRPPCVTAPLALHILNPDSLTQHVRFRLASIRPLLLRMSHSPEPHTRSPTPLHRPRPSSVYPSLHPANLDRAYIPSSSLLSSQSPPPPHGCHTHPEGYQRPHVKIHLQSGKCSDDQPNKPPQ